MILHSLSLLLVLTGAVLAQDAPRITIADDSASDGSERLGGGSDPMQQLLNWAIEHSDPDRVKELMQKYQEQNLTIKDVYGQDMIDALFVNEGSVMLDKVLEVVDFKNASLSDEELENGLYRLQELVEQVDNAGNLHGMGGLKPLLDLGAADEIVDAQRGVKRSEATRALSLWTLGVALQNNEPVQSALVDLGGLPILLNRLPLCSGKSTGESAGNEYCSKLLFAISAVIRNNVTTQTAADTGGLFDWLIDAGMSHPSLGVAKKSLGLLDICLAQSPSLNVVGSLPQKQDAIGRQLLTYVHSADVQFDADLTEKSLRLMNRLLSLRPMLFSTSFRSELKDLVAKAVKSCEQLHGANDELCEGLSGLATTADLVLAARDLSDEEL